MRISAFLSLLFRNFPPPSVLLNSHKKTCNKAERKRRGKASNMPQAVSINAFAHLSEFALVSKIEMAIDDLTVSSVPA